MPRELIDTGKDKRYVRRDAGGRFNHVVDVGRSLAQDRRTKAKRTVSGEGDRGDQRPRNATTKAATTRSRKKATTRAARSTASKTKRGRRTTAVGRRSTKKARVRWRA